jgi:hypothetical protein
MNHYQSRPGRFFEILVGLVTGFISLIFIGLFLLLILNAGLKYVTFIGGAILFLCAYWFVVITIRLLFNIPNKHGGLLSIGGLRFLCVFLGVSALPMGVLALYMGEWLVFGSCILFCVGCFKGWHLANVRRSA